MKPALVLAIGIASAGCRTVAYAPRNDDAVLIVMTPEGPALLRDDLVIPMGLTWDGVQEGVAGDPAAEELAATASGRAKTGMGLAVAGLLGPAAGAVILLSSPDTTGAILLNLGLLLAGTALSTGGLMWQSSGSSYVFEAVNAFNEDARSDPMLPPR